MSLVLRGAPEPLSLLAGVAVCDVVGEDARVKWPNDVVIEEGSEDRPSLKKLAGILVEGRPQDGWAVLGIGLNVAVLLSDMPEELRDRAATLGMSPGEIVPVLAALLGALERRLYDRPEVALARWGELDALRGRAVSWGDKLDRGTPHKGCFSGRAEGIDDAGRLIVVVQAGTREVRLDAGEVHLSREVAR